MALVSDIVLRACDPLAEDVAEAATDTGTATRGDARGVGIAGAAGDCVAIRSASSGVDGTGGGGLGVALGVVHRSPCGGEEGDAATAPLFPEAEQRDSAESELPALPVLPVSGGEQPPAASISPTGDGGTSVVPPPLLPKLESSPSGVGSDSGAGEVKDSAAAPASPCSSSP
mmetsp:Transcript_112890/g.326107  ORF Transcript_112890/g.326107 Transcript_112890/m.326107 type:complete len:172 (-) Transcript_112890:815-1330(-)